MLVRSALLWAVFLASTAAVWFDSPLTKQHWQQRKSFARKATAEPPIPHDDAQEALYRLPSYIVPRHYHLRLRSEVHTGNRSYEGSVDIDLEVQQTTRTISIHNRNLNILSSEVFLLNNASEPSFLEEPRYVADVIRQYTVFNTRQGLTPGRYMIRLNFTGELRTDDDGFYLSSYVADDGTTKYLAVTQFQAVSARSAFPCLDEPGFKATVRLEIEHHSSTQAVANMPIEAEGAGEYFLTIFQTTQPMSIYLLAFMISDFEYLQSDGNRVFARPTAIDETEYAYEAGVQILNTLDTYVGIPYSNYMPKLDQIALPDFAAGAMENWGLCTYREEYLLFKPGTTTYRTRTFITTIIAHEYIHQWFGNVVTNEWWSYLWLNEGFATLYEYMGADLAYPEREYRELFYIEVVHSALNSDSSEQTRPMSYSRGALQSQIESLFDAIAYFKAGSVLQMFRLILSDELWRTMIRTYLEENEFTAVNPDDLIAAMDNVTTGVNILPADVTMEQFVKSWTDQAGSPVLDVRRTQRGDIVISQERFYNNKIMVDDPAEWIIPYTLGDASMASLDNLPWQWLTTRASRVSTTAANDQWILANVHQAGFYRVNYDVQNWYLLIDALQEDHMAIPLRSRSQLLDDAFRLSRANRLDTEIVLELVVYLQEEQDYPPWDVGSRVLSYFYDRLQGSSDYSNFQAYVGTLIAELYDTMEVTNVSPEETLLYKHLKQTITLWACTIDFGDCLEETRTALEEEATGGEAVHPDVSQVVYCHGLRTTTSAAFQYLLNKLNESRNVAERNNLINALGCSSDRGLLNELLVTAVTDDSYSFEERIGMLQSVLGGGSNGVDEMTSYLGSNYTAVLDSFGPGILNNLLQSIASQTNNEPQTEQLNDLLDTLAAVVTDTVRTNIQQTVNRNRAWPDTREGVVTRYFLERYAVSH